MVTQVSDYNPTNWTETTPITPANLNKMEQGIKEAHDEAHAAQASADAPVIETAGLQVVSEAIAVNPSGDIPGFEVGFTLEKDTACLLYMNAQVYIERTDTDVGAWGDLYLTIDGNEEPGSRRGMEIEAQPMSNTVRLILRGNISVQMTKVLAAGEHTIKGRWAIRAAGTVASIGPRVLGVVLLHR